MQNVHVKLAFFIRRGRVFKCPFFLPQRQQEETPRGVSQSLLVNVGLDPQARVGQFEDRRHSMKVIHSGSDFREDRTLERVKQQNNEIKASTFFDRIRGYYEKTYQGSKPGNCSICLKCFFFCSVECEPRSEG